MFLFSKKQLIQFLLLQKFYPLVFQKVKSMIFIRMPIKLGSEIGYCRNKPD
jgi:hypothetical protein